MNGAVCEKFTFDCVYVEPCPFTKKILLKQNFELLTLFFRYILLDLSLFSNLYQQQKIESDINISHNLIKNEQRINESKNFLLTTVKGNQICCDCGAPNPSWVMKHSHE